MVTILQAGRLIQVPLESLLNGEQGIQEGKEETKSGIIFEEDRLAERAAIAPSESPKKGKQGSKRNLSSKGE